MTRIEGSRRSGRTGGRRATIALLLAGSVGLLATLPTAGASALVEPRMDYHAAHFPLVSVPAADLPYMTWDNPHMPPDWRPTDADGVRMRNVNGKLYYHPVELGFSALRLLGGYAHTGRPGFLKWARIYAAKIRHISVASDGALFVPYRFDYPTESLRAPWYSGMAQGVALSVFTRLYRITHDPADLDTAKRLFKSFQRSGPSARPWVSRVSEYHYLWIEEYPRNDREDRVLNGFMYAMFGLYDYWKLVRDEASRHVLEGTLTTLKTQIWRYRVPGRISYYCLGHHTRIAKYHLVHIEQLRYLAKMSGDPFFARVADQFESDWDGSEPPR